MTVPRGTARYLLDRPSGHPNRLGLEALARGSGIHPDLLRRFVALSLLDADRDTAGRLWFSSTAPAAVARIQRLHAGLPLNYAAIGLVIDLLDRIDRLEAALRAAPGVALRAADRPAGRSASWTRTG
jgi:chaperone modulatory protein CbpM